MYYYLFVYFYVLFIFPPAPEGKLLRTVYLAFAWPVRGTGWINEWINAYLAPIPSFFLSNLGLHFPFLLSNLCATSDFKNYYWLFSPYYQLPSKIGVNGISLLNITFSYLEFSTDPDFAPLPSPSPNTQNKAFTMNTTYCNGIQMPAT